MVYYPSRLVEKIHHFFTPPGMPWCPRTSSYTAGSTCRSYGFLVVSRFYNRATTHISWLVVYLSLWKMMEFVSWDDFPFPIIQLIWKVIKFHGSSHHQPVSIIKTRKECHEFRNHFSASNCSVSVNEAHGWTVVTWVIWVDQCCGSAEMLWTTDLYILFVHKA